jgi:hypothetical protein
VIEHTLSLGTGKKQRTRVNGKCAYQTMAFRIVNLESRRENGIRIHVVEILKRPVKSARGR